MIKKIEAIEPLYKKVKCKSNYIDESRDKGDELVFKIGCTYEAMAIVPKTGEYLIKIRDRDIYLCGADDFKNLFDIEE